MDLSGYKLAMLHQDTELVLCRASAGAADGPAVLLLHGWPYDIHSLVDVAPLLRRPDTE